MKASKFFAVALSVVMSVSMAKVSFGQEMTLTPKEMIEQASENASAFTSVKLESVSDIKTEMNMFGIDVGFTMSMLYDILIDDDRYGILGDISIADLPVESPSSSFGVYYDGFTLYSTDSENSGKWTTDDDDDEATMTLDDVLRGGGIATVLPKTLSTNDAITILFDNMYFAPDVTNDAGEFYVIKADLVADEFRKVLQETMGTLSGSMGEMPNNFEELAETMEISGEYTFYIEKTSLLLTNFTTVMQLSYQMEIEGLQAKVLQNITTESSYTGYGEPIDFTFITDNIVY